MIYADTDFFLALMKPQDWLKARAEKLYRENKGKIATSLVTLVELALISRRLGLDIESITASVFGISEVKGLTIEEGLRAAHLIKDEGVGIFDAFHAVICGDR